MRLYAATHAPATVTTRVGRAALHPSRPVQPISLVPSDCQPRMQARVWTPDEGLGGDAGTAQRTHLVSHAHHDMQGDPPSANPLPSALVFPPLGNGSTRAVRRAVCKQRTRCVLSPARSPPTIHPRSGAFRLRQDDKAAKLKALDGDLGFLVEQDVAAAQGVPCNCSAVQLDGLHVGGTTPNPWEAKRPSHRCVCGHQQAVRAAQGARARA